MVEAHGAAQHRCTTVWSLAGVPSILGIRCWSIFLGGMLQLSITISSAHWLFPLSHIIFEYFLKHLWLLVLMKREQHNNQQHGTMWYEQHLMSWVMWDLTSLANREWHEILSWAQGTLQVQDIGHAMSLTHMRASTLWVQAWAPKPNKSANRTFGCACF